MSLVRVLEAAAELLDAVDGRIGAADNEWIAYDHAGREAEAFAAGALQVAITHPTVAAQCLEHALTLLHSLPLPTPRYVFQDRIKAELAALGLPFEVNSALLNVA